MGVNIDKSGKVGGAGSDGFLVLGIAASGLNGQDANCNWIDDDCARNGQPGAPGMMGGAGGEGQSGTHAASFLVIEVDSFDFDVSVGLRGGTGGKGGRGGDGQQGGKGGRGGNGNDCELGQHGGNGGNGGASGAGGLGGRGGRGGKVSVIMKQAAHPQSMAFDVFGGSGGLAGDSGIPGLPGAPGDDGSTSGVFSTSSDCETMGPSAGWGNAGAVPNTLGRGPDGVDGPEPETKVIP